jgi:nitrate/TMAO reductase-like tetraheme cytochrome c subunit
MDHHGKTIFALFTRHWLSFAGAGLMTTAGILWLFTLSSQLSGRGDNPYIGLILFGVLPVLFILGLVMIPAGLWASRRRLRTGLAEIVDDAASRRRLVVFLSITTVANLLIGSQVTYSAVHHLESPGFCGASCHAMQPQHTAYREAAHSRVKCTDCHVGPGARGWIASKMGGMRQFLEVAFDSFERPIPPATVSGRLVPATQTCENCHWSEKEHASKVRIIRSFAEDAANTPSVTVLTMRIGGGLLRARTDRTSGQESRFPTPRPIESAKRFLGSR